MTNGDLDYLKLLRTVRLGLWAALALNLLTPVLLGLEFGFQPGTIANVAVLPMVFVALRINGAAVEREERRAGK